MSGLKLYWWWQRRKCHRQPHPQKSQQNCREGALIALKPHVATTFHMGFLRKSGIYPNVWLLFMGKMCFSGYHGISSTKPHGCFDMFQRAKGASMKWTGKMNTRIHQKDPTCPYIYCICLVGKPTVPVVSHGIAISQMFHAPNPCNNVRHRLGFNVALPKAY